MLRFVCFSLVILLAAPAAAQSVPGEIQYVRKIEVVFSEGAGKCGIEDEKMYSDHLMKKLDGLGIKENPDRFVVAQISVTAAPQGTSICMIHTGIRFNAALSKDNIVTDDKLINAAMERLEVLPMTLWYGGTLMAREYFRPSSGSSGRMIDRAAKAVLEQIDLVMDRFAKERAG